MNNTPAPPPHRAVATVSARATVQATLLAAAFATVLVLAGCAAAPPATPTATAVAPQWQAPLPAADRSVALAQWWAQFKDPALDELIAAAQAVSPSLAAARSRIEQARAARVASGAALGPTLDGTAALVRGRQDLITPLGSSASAGLQAAWEIDLFGANRAGRDAAQARLDSAQLGWHDARTAVAAEVGSAYLGLRACEAQLEQTELDAISRAQTARLTGLSAQAGFQAPASAELARASAAQGHANVAAQRAQCDLSIKALVALSAIPEPELRTRLAPGRARLPQPASLRVAQLPAEALAQRPDLASAERDLAAAAADTDQLRAQRYPRVTLAGSLGAAHLASGAGSASGTTWTVGPLSVTLPLFDGGVRRANVEAAQSRFDAAASSYAARLRTAVREVEEALVALQSTAARGDDARVAAQGFARSYLAVESRHQGGLASLFELEDARRSAVQAQSALIDLERERVAAWIALYRALGGGWSTADATPAAASPPPLTPPSPPRG